jgi:hypothetical protein
MSAMAPHESRGAAIIGAMLVTAASVPGCRTVTAG